MALISEYSGYIYVVAENWQVEGNAYAVVRQLVDRIEALERLVQEKDQDEDE